MYSSHKLLFTSILCIAGACLNASAISGHPQISVQDANEPIAIGQTVQISYVDNIALSPASTLTFSLDWSCYVNGELQPDFPKPYGPTNVNSKVTSWPAGSGTFPFSKTTAGTYEVYCTASGDATAHSTPPVTGSISGTSNTLTIQVSACTGEADYSENGPTENGGYITTSWTLSAIMSPPSSLNQPESYPGYGLTGNLIAAGPPYEFDCDGDLNGDEGDLDAEFYPEIQENGQQETASNTSINFFYTLLNETEYIGDSCGPCDAFPSYLYNVTLPATPTQVPETITWQCDIF